MRTRLADLRTAPFEHIVHAQFTADLLHVHGAALVCEAGISGDHEQPARARQRCNDLFDDAVAEIILLRVATQVVERQHRDGGAVGQRRFLMWRRAD